MNNDPLEDQEKQNQQEMADQMTSESASSPADAAMGGQNPDQAKMQGTPNQQQGLAGRLAENNPQQNQQQAQRHKLQSREDYLQTTTPQQRADQAEADRARNITQQLQGMGSFAGRIESLVQANLANRAEDNLVSDQFFLEEAELQNMAAEGHQETVQQAFNEVQGLINSGANTEQVIAHLQSVPTEAWGEKGLYDAMQRIYKTDQDSLNSAITDALVNGVINPEELNAEAVIKASMSIMKPSR